MSNIYVGQMKDTVRNFQKKTKANNKEIRNAVAMYSKEYAKEAVKPLNEKRDTNYNNAVDSVVKVYNQVRTYLAISSFPNVEQLTADKLLFDSNSVMDLSPAEVASFAERYNNNPTMSRLIKQWVDTKHPGTNEYSEVADKIILPSDMLDIYKTFAEGAIKLIQKIYAESVKMPLDNDADNNSMEDSRFNLFDTEIEAYADEDFCKGMFDIIGDGFHLSDCSNSRLPQSAEHCFDNINLVLPDSNTNMHYANV